MRACSAILASFFSNMIGGSAAATGICLLPA
jgi:hypothetical protein